MALLLTNLQDTEPKMLMNIYVGKWHQRRPLSNSSPADSMADEPASEMFLRSEFRMAQNLAIFNSKSKVILRIDDYIQRVSELLFIFMDSISFNTDGDEIIENIVAPF